MHFILAILTLILSINCQADYPVFLNSHTQGTNITVAHQHDLPNTFNFRKDNRNECKNTIRIKAWDDATPINVPATWQPQVTRAYFTRSSYLGYTITIFQVISSSHSLRGPPELI
jgi:hypothetical protein